MVFLFQIFASNGFEVVCKVTFQVVQPPTRCYPRGNCLVKFPSMPVQNFEPVESICCLGITCIVTDTKWFIPLWGTATSGQKAVKWVTVSKIAQEQRETQARTLQMGAAGMQWWSESVTWALLDRWTWCGTESRYQSRERAGGVMETCNTDACSFLILQGKC